MTLLPSRLVACTSVLALIAACVSQQGQPTNDAPADRPNVSDSSTPPDPPADAAVEASSKVAPPAVIDPVQIARAAVVLAACFPDDRAASRMWGFFYERAEGQIPPPRPWHEEIACLLTPSQNGDPCEPVERCLGAFAGFDGPCEPSCDGNIYKHCDDSRSFAVDCAKGQGSCMISGCTIPRAPCSTVFAVDCVDGQPRRCETDGWHVGPNCADLGLVCDARRGCAGAGAACPSAYGTDSYGGGLRCDGNAVVACIGRRESTVDCSAVAPGMACQTLGTSVFCGFSNECDPRTTMDRCEGNTLVTCAAGKEVALDCTELGFTTCLPNQRTCGPGRWLP